MTLLPPLMVITDRRATGGRPLGEVVHAALRGGARLVQLREKDLHAGPLLALAHELRALTRRFDARLLVNDRLEVALACDADGVVLPGDSFEVADARRILGAGKWIGRSTHGGAEVERAMRDGADFAIFGPVFATPSKAAFGEPRGLEALSRAARAGLPVYGVGGIDAGNARTVIEAGGAGVAVIRAVVAASDPSDAVARLLSEISGGGQEPRHRRQ